MKRICFISTIPLTLRTFVLKTAIYLHENTDWILVLFVVKMKNLLQSYPNLYIIFRFQWKEELVSPE